MIKNSFWFRHYLVCNDIAHRMCEVHGWANIQNFAKLIKEEEEGRYGNSQMTAYFWAADQAMCDLHCSEMGDVFDMLEEEGTTLEMLANLTEEETEDYYNNCCFGHMIKLD